MAILISMSATLFILILFFAIRFIICRMRKLKRAKNQHALKVRKSSKSPKNSKDKADCKVPQTPSI